MQPLSPIAIPSVPQTALCPAAAATQDGVFTRSQARRAGWADDRQRRLLRTGLWVPITASVMRPREVDLGPWQRARAVWLSSGRIISHATAAALWGLECGTDLHGIRRSGRSIAGIVDHRMQVDGAELTTLHGMVVTSPVRTVADVLCSMRVSRSIEVVTDGLRRGVLDVDTLRAAARGTRGRPGARRARFIVQSCSDRPFSVLEWRFHRLVRGSGRGWVFNTEVTDDAGTVGIVDALHVPSRTVVELDGRRFHGEQRFQGDRTRDQRLAAAGYVVLRFTWDDIDCRPDHVREVMLRTIAVRSRSAPAPTPQVGGRGGST